MEDLGEYVSSYLYIRFASFQSWGPEEVELKIDPFFWKLREEVWKVLEYETLKISRSNEQRAMHPHEKVPTVREKMAMFSWKNNSQRKDSINILFFILFINFQRNELVGTLASSFDDQWVFFQN